MCDGRRVSRNIMLDGEPLEEMECLKYLGSKVTVGGNIKMGLKI